MSEIARGILWGTGAGFLLSAVIGLAYTAVQRWRYRGRS